MSIPDNNYTGTTENFKNYVVQNTPSIRQSTEYQAASNDIQRLNQAAQTTLKIGLEEIGVFRQLYQTGGKANTPGLDIYQTKSVQFAGEINNNYTTQLGSLNRQDPMNEFVFRCGDYFLPISFSYTLVASKKHAISELVDGAEIIQQTFRKPKIINLNMKVETNEARLSNESTASNSAFINAQYSGVETEDRVLYAVMSLRAVLNDLWEENNVFRIVQKTLNNDLNLDWVYLSDFEMEVTPGTTMINIKMTLREVNMLQNSIIQDRGIVSPYFNPTDAG